MNYEQLIALRDSVDSEPEGLVYFICQELRDGRAVKIGRCVDFKSRYRHIRMDNVSTFPALLVKGGRNLERALHQKFASLRLRGEWFALVGELADMIADFGSKKYGEIEEEAEEELVEAWLA